MAVKMRLTRLGDKKSPFYRVVVADSRKTRDGEYVDLIGTYNPLKTPEEVNIDVEKAKKWLSQGAQPTDTVKALLVKSGAIEQKKSVSKSKKTACAPAKKAKAE